MCTRTVSPHVGTTKTVEVQTVTRGRPSTWPLERVVFGSAITASTPQPPSSADASTSAGIAEGSDQWPTGP